MPPRGRNSANMALRQKPAAADAARPDAASASTTQCYHRLASAPVDSLSTSPLHRQSQPPPLATGRYLAALYHYIATSTTSNTQPCATRAASQGRGQQRFIVLARCLDAVAAVA